MATRDAIETHVLQNDLCIQIEGDWPIEQTQERHPPALREGLETLPEGSRMARHFKQDVHPIAIGLRTYHLDDIHLQRVEHPGGTHALGELTPQRAHLRRQDTGGPG